MVSQTRIVYNEKELLQLMCQHLMDIGFKKTAIMLQQEAKLPNVPASRLSITPASLSPFVCCFIFKTIFFARLSFVNIFYIFDKG